MNNPNTTIFENQDAAQDRFEAACIELVGGHTPRHGLENEDLRQPPAHYDIECAIGDILDIVEGLLVDTVNEDDLIDVTSGMVTSLHYILSRINRRQDDVQSEIRRLDREFDGSEIKDVQLQQQTNLMQQTDRRAEGLETLRDVMAEFIYGRYNHRWHPPRGNHVSDRRPISAAVVEARDFVKARDNQKRDALTPEGTLIGFAGGKDFNDHTVIWSVLDRIRTRHPDIVLVHGGARSGAELIAARWADTRGVAQVKCTPDWKVHAKAAPFKRNDEMLKLGLIGLVACPGNGITDNLIDKAKQKRLNVKIIN